MVSQSTLQAHGKHKVASFVWEKKKYCNQLSFIKAKYCAITCILPESKNVRDHKTSTAG